jgi:hypothetical protein
VRIPKSIQKKKGHPLGWKCPDCEDWLEPSYDDTTPGALTICMSCLAIINSEDGAIRLQPYEELHPETRVMIITGINTALAMRAYRELIEIAKDSSRN